MAAEKSTGVFHWFAPGPPKPDKETAPPIPGLEDVAWDRLRLAEGYAHDVPYLLAELGSQFPRVRQRAHSELYALICPQGTRYEAALPAIDFVVGLLESEWVRDKERLLDMLVDLAVGDPDSHLPQGIQPQLWESQVAQLDAADLKMHGCGPAVALDCYRAGVAQLGRLHQIFDQQASLRTSLAFVLAWFPEGVQESRARLESLLTGPPVQAATALISLGLLQRESGSSYQPTLDSPELCVRCAAALATSPPSLAAFEVLCQGLRERKQLNECAIPFKSGDWLAYIALTLARYGDDYRDRSLECLLPTLPSADPMTSIAITRAVLELVGAGPVDDLRRPVLAAIQQHGCWSVHGSPFSPYRSLLSSFGWPDDRQQLAELVS